MSGKYCGGYADHFCVLLQILILCLVYKVLIWWTNQDKLALGQKGLNFAITYGKFQSVNHAEEYKKGPQLFWKGTLLPKEMFVK